MTDPLTTKNAASAMKYEAVYAATAYNSQSPRDFPEGRTSDEHDGYFTRIAYDTRRPTSLCKTATRLWASSISLSHDPSLHGREQLSFNDPTDIHVLNRIS